MEYRYFLNVKCKCGGLDEEVCSTPASGTLKWQCLKCKEVINLEECSEIDIERCENTEEGAKVVRELKRNLKRRIRAMREVE